MAEEEALRRSPGCTQLRAPAWRSLALSRLCAAHARAVALSAGGWGRTEGVELELEGQGGAPVTWPPPAVAPCMEEGAVVRQLAV